MQKTDITYLRELFKDNGGGFEDKVKFKLEDIPFFSFFSIDTEECEEGIKRFQGVIYWKRDGVVSSEPFPLKFLKQASSYTYKIIDSDGRFYIVWTVWFEKPIGIKKINNENKHS